MSASTASAARRPSMRASAFSSTMASAVAWSARRRRRARPRGRRRRRTGCRWRARPRPGGELGRGTSGLSAMPVRNDGGERGDEHRAGERGADRRAEVGDRVLEAADLAALLVGHRRHGDGAELRRQRADAEAGEQHRPGHDLGPGAGVEQRDHARRCPANSARNPSRTTRRGEAFGEELRDADRGEQQRDRQRQEPHAGGDRRQPERDRQEQRHREEQARPAAGTGRRTR